MVILELGTSLNMSVETHLGVTIISHHPVSEQSHKQMEQISC